MTVQVVEISAELAHESTEDPIIYEGYAALARRLNKLHPNRRLPISRQLVHRWFLRRETNGFPPPHPIAAKSGRMKNHFDAEAVERWHITHLLHHRQTMEIETIPLFQVDSTGKLVA